MVRALTGCERALESSRKETPHVAPKSRFEGGRLLPHRGGVRRLYLSGNDLGWQQHTFWGLGKHRRHDQLERTHTHVVAGDHRVGNHRSGEPRRFRR